MIRKDPVIVEIAAKYKVSSNHVILAWHLARDTIIVPKSVNETRQKENLNVSSSAFVDTMYDRLMRISIATYAGGRGREENQRIGSEREDLQQA